MIFKASLAIFFHYSFLKSLSTLFRTASIQATLNKELKYQKLFRKAAQFIYIVALQKEVHQPSLFPWNWRGLPEIVLLFHEHLLVAIFETLESWESTTTTIIARVPFATLKICIFCCCFSLPPSWLWVRLSFCSQTTRPALQVFRLAQRLVSNTFTPFVWFLPHENIEGWLVKSIHN